MPELLISLGIVTVLGVIGVLMISSLRKTTSLAEQRSELQALKNSIAVLMAKDLSESLRVDQFNSAVYPGVRRQPDIKRDGNEIDGLSILIPQFPQFPISVSYSSTSPSDGLIVIANQNSTADDQLFGLHYKASVLFNLFSIASSKGKSVIQRTGPVHRENNAVNLQFDIPNNQSVPFAGTELMLRPVQQILYLVENGQLKRKVKYDPSDNGAIIDERILATNVQDFKIDYDFFDFDHKAGANLRLPSIPVSHPAATDAAGCPDGVPASGSITCGGWQHIARLNVSLVLQSEKSVNQILDSQNAEGFSISSDKHLVFASKFTLFPYGYSGLGNLVSQQGSNLNCSIYDPNSRCTVGCAGANGNFTGHDINQPDWEGYGKPAYLENGQVNPDASDYCRCGTNPATRDFKPPETDAGRTATQMPKWIDPGTGQKDALQGSRYQACARHFDLCANGQEWLKDIYPPSYFACNCTQPGPVHPNGYYPRSSGRPYTFSQQTEDDLTSLASNLAYAPNERSCATWGGCDAKANEISGNNANRFYRDRCRCLTKNIDGQGNIQPGVNVGAEWHLSYYDICSLAANPGSPMGSGDGYCPDTYDPVGSGYYKIYDAVSNPRGLSNELAELCACLRSFWKTREGFHDNNNANIFSPKNGASSSNWDFRKAAAGSESPWDQFGLQPNANRTTASTSYETLPTITVKTYANGQPAPTQLSNSAQGVNCGLAHLQASGVYDPNFTNCVQRLEPQAESDLGFTSSFQTSYSGYCRTGFKATRSDSGNPRSGTGACGSVAVGAYSPEADKIRRTITGVGSGPLPNGCGGDESSGSTSTQP